MKKIINSSYWDFEGISNLFSFLKKEGKKRKKKNPLTRCRDGEGGFKFAQYKNDYLSKI